MTFDATVKIKAHVEPTLYDVQLVGGQTRRDIASEMLVIAKFAGASFLWRSCQTLQEFLI